MTKANFFPFSPFWSLRFRSLFGYWCLEIGVL
jgi:hypothetical protein